MFEERGVGGGGAGRGGERGWLTEGNASREERRGQLHVAQRAFSYTWRSVLLAQEEGRHVSHAVAQEYSALASLLLRQFALRSKALVLLYAGTGLDAQIPVLSTWVLKKKASTDT